MELADAEQGAPSPYLPRSGSKAIGARVEFSINGTIVEGRLEEEDDYSEASGDSGARGHQRSDDPGRGRSARRRPNPVGLDDGKSASDAPQSSRADVKEFKMGGAYSAARRSAPGNRSYVSDNLEGS